MIARLLLALVALALAAPAQAQDRAEIERTMRRATTYMVEQVATEGGYVWSYLPDHSRRWGESRGASPRSQRSSTLPSGPGPRSTKTACGWMRSVSAGRAPRSHFIRRKEDWKTQQG